MLGVGFIKMVFVIQDFHSNPQKFELFYILLTTLFNKVFLSFCLHKSTHVQGPNEPTKVAY